jgi:hypothetical protein
MVLKLNYFCEGQDNNNFLIDFECEAHECFLTLLNL